MEALVSFWCVAQARSGATSIRSQHFALRFQPSGTLEVPVGQSATLSLGARWIGQGNRVTNFVWS